jgi:hypothetical protein
MPRQLVEMRNAFDPDQALPDPLPDELIQLYRDLLGAGSGCLAGGDPRAAHRTPCKLGLAPGRCSDGVQIVRYRGQFLDELRAAGPLPDVPLIVLTATDIDDFRKAVSTGEDESLMREEIDGTVRLYTALAESVPRGENRLVDGAGHASIHWRRPDAVIQAVRDLLGS